jgi:hypothetical protein
LIVHVKHDGLRAAIRPFTLPALLHGAANVESLTKTSSYLLNVRILGRKFVSVAAVLNIAALLGPIVWPWSQLVATGINNCRRPVG